MADEPTEPTLLRALITARHWQKFATFEAQFRRAARELAEQQQEPELAKVTVSSRQWERWYAGKVKTAPHPDACRVLEYMFGYSVQQLLAPASQPAATPSGHLEASNNNLVPAESSGTHIFSAVYRPLGWPVVAGEGAFSNPSLPGGVPYPDELTRLLLHLQPLTALGPDGTISAQARDATFTRLVQSLTTWAHTMKRRELLQILGWATTAAMASPTLTRLNADEQERVARAIAAPSRVDETVIEHIEEVLHHCLRQDDALGPQAALDTILAQRALVQTMLMECPSRLRPRLLSVYSDLTSLTGWLSFDLNDFDSAWYYYEQARTAAHEAHSSALGALVLCQMSHLAAWEHKPRVAIDHAVAAQRWAGYADDARLQAYAHQVAARAYAMDDWHTSPASCHAELEHAEACFDNGDTSNSIVHFNTHAQLLGDRSRCLLQLAEPTAAVASAQEALKLSDRSFVRNTAFTYLYLGRAHLQTGEVEQATVFVGDAVELTARNRSARLMEEVQGTLRDLQQWHDSKAVQELLERSHALVGHLDVRSVHTNGARHGS